MQTVKPGVEYRIRLGESFSTHNSYHSLRCMQVSEYLDNFVPDTMDRNNGSFSQHQGEATFSFNHLQGKGNVVFMGPQTHCDSDCLLFYDAESNEFVLEKQSSFFTLKNQRKGKSAVAAAVSPQEPVVANGESLSENELAEMVENEFADDAE